MSKDAVLSEAYVGKKKWGYAVSTCIPLACLAILAFLVDVHNPAYCFLVAIILLSVVIIRCQRDSLIENETIYKAVRELGQEKRELR